MDGCATMDIPGLDGNVSENAHQGTSPHNEEEERIKAVPVIRRASHHEIHKVDGLSTVRERMRERGIFEAGTELIMASWKPGREKQYRLHLKRWTQFCSQWEVDPFTPTVEQIINFLSETFRRGVGYECINTARAALSSLGIVVDGRRAGDHPLVVRLLKRVFNLRPAKPRYIETWDVKPVLEKLRGMSPLHSLSLKDLTLKSVMLLALMQAARVQTLQLVTFKGYHRQGF
ncbi:uncharacterized protein LOC123509093 [Portunus trituberculatus]|uniref:uncharacterized protein LOC123509093 n=1 Tax=Portunus trituberculatus TaxID=210409 RepID=UPI001E1CCDC8|nr:uncharacterized protein LOC123509093 [Portunus trituberculatus]